MARLSKKQTSELAAAFGAAQATDIPELWAAYGRRLRGYLLPHATGYDMVKVEKNLRLLMMEVHEREVRPAWLRSQRRH